MPSAFTTPKEIEVGKLLLDEKNPRIPLDKQSLSQDELVVYVAENYFSFTVARSIAEHEYFPSEPLIAIPVRGSDTFTVVEGNRRLAALKLLLDPKLREKLSSRKEWDDLPTRNVPKKVPVVIVKKRRDVAPIIGYRHISGIQQWEPDAKARYIAHQIDSEGLSFKDTARDVGESENAVRTHYRNYHIAKQAEELTGKSKIHPESLAGMKRDFGTFTRAMTGNMITFIGAPVPSQVVKGKKPVPAAKKDELKEMIEMLFGPTAVLEESRNVTELGKALSTKEGVEALRKTGSLEEGVAASGGTLDRLIQRLANASRNLRSAKVDFSKHKKNADVQRHVQDCIDALEDLK